MVQTPWWLDKSAPHEKIFSLVRQQYADQAGRYSTFRRHRNVYEFGWKGVDRSAKYDRTYDDTSLHFNRAQNAVDTVISEVTSAKVAPMATTEGGTWEQRDNAEKATRALDGLFQELDFDSLFEEAAIDACHTGCGFIKVFSDLSDCEVKAERVDPMDMLVDEREALSGTPRCIYQRCLVDKWYLAEACGVPNGALEASAATRRTKVLDAGIPDLFPGETWDTDALIEVVEAWHLPSFVTDEEESDDDASESGPGRKRRRRSDGRHVMCIDDFTLRDEAWNRPYFPFLVYRPKKARRGFWGIPLMRQLAPGQKEAEELDRKLQRAHRRMGGSHYLAHKSAKIEKRKVTNDIGDILEWEGQHPPQEWTPAPANPQTYQYRETLASDMLRFIGSSQFAAQSSVPRGMEQASGRALQLVVDQGSKYLGPWLRERERIVRRAGDMVLDAVEEVVEADGDYAAKYVSGRGYERIDWKPIVEQRKALVIRVEPINALSTSPGARVAQATEWLQAGAIQAPQWRRLSGIPDLEAENELDMADEEIIKKTLDFMVRTGKPIMIEPWDDWAKILEIGGRFVNMCRRQEVPENRLAVVRDYLGDAKAKIDDEKAKQAAAAAANAPPPPMPGPPGGMPMSPDAMGGAMPLDAMQAMPPEMGEAMLMPPGMPAAA